MLARLLLLLTIVPLVELGLLLTLGKYTSVSFTLAFVILTGIAGAVLLRYQGWQTFRNVQRDLSQGQLPAESLADGLMILIAAVLLMTPGVLTDVIGFSLLIPAARRWYRAWVLAWLRRRIEVRFGPLRPPKPERPEVIDSYVVPRSGESPPRSDNERLP
jgi:UPF0716 protein FxsA